MIVRIYRKDDDSDNEEDGGGGLDVSESNIPSGGMGGIDITAQINSLADGYDMESRGKKGGPLPYMGGKPSPSPAPSGSASAATPSKGKAGLMTTLKTLSSMPRMAASLAASVANPFNIATGVPKIAEAQAGGNGGGLVKRPDDDMTHELAPRQDDEMTHELATETPAPAEGGRGLVPPGWKESPTIGMGGQKYITRTTDEGGIPKVEMKPLEGSITKEKWDTDVARADEERISGLMDIRKQEAARQQEAFGMIKDITDRLNGPFGSTFSPESRNAMLQMKNILSGIVKGGGGGGGGMDVGQLMQRREVLGAKEETAKFNKELKLEQEKRKGEEARNKNLIGMTKLGISAETRASLKTASFDKAIRTLGEETDETTGKKTINYAKGLKEARKLGKVPPGENKRATQIIEAAEKKVEAARLKFGTINDRQEQMIWEDAMRTIDKLAK